MADFLNDKLQEITGPIFQSGKKLDDAVTIKMAGAVYDGWSSVNIAKSIDQLAPSFTIKIADKWRQNDEAWPFMPGRDVNIYIGETLVISGFVEQLQSSVSNQDRSITISGRNRIGDIIDSSAIDQKLVFKNISLVDLATTYIGGFSLTAQDLSSKAGEKIKKVVVNQGEGIFELLDRHARQLGVLLNSDAKGNLIITNAGGARAITSNQQDEKKFLNAILSGGLSQEIKPFVGATGELTQGVNVLFASASFDDTDRFQRYIVSSQFQGNDNVKARNTASQATFTDPELVAAGSQGTTGTGTASSARQIARPRTKYIVADKSADNAECLERAKWEANVRAARAAQATVTVQGWKDQSGQLWDVNQLVNCDLRFIGFAKNQYLITDVRYVQDVRNGTTAQLTVGRADSFASEPFVAKEPGTDAGWAEKFGNVGTERRDVADIVDQVLESGEKAVKSLL